MRFCQTDGSPLVDVVAEAPEDPYKTVVAPQEPLPEPPAPPDDPFKTMVASAPLVPEPEGSGDLLEMPGIDPLRTMYVSEEEIRQEMESNKPDEDPGLDVPASEPEPPAPEPPVFSEPSLSPPAFGDAPPPSPFGSAEPSDPSPWQEPESEAPATNSATEDETLLGAPVPIPSPFNDSAPQSYEPPPLEPESYSPTTPPAPEYKDPEPAANPFDQGFGGGSSPQAMDWAPPPSPEPSWQNEPVGQNTPFQPPAAGTGSVNQVLPIVSLVFGIVSVCCYISPLTGLVALITGFMGMKNVNKDPANYGGKGLAIAGMITGGVFFVLGVFYWIYIIFIVGLAALGSLPR